MLLNTTMDSLDYTIKRPLSPETSIRFMELQARVSRIVGTHAGSPIRLFNLENLGVVMADVATVRNTALASGRTRLSLGTIIRDGLPESHKGTVPAKVEEVNISRASKGSVLYVSLGSAVLKRETVSIHESLFELSDAARDIPRMAHLIPVAGVDEQYVDDVLDFAGDFLGLQSHELSVSLAPMKFFDQAQSYRRRPSARAV